MSALTQLKQRCLCTYSGMILRDAKAFEVLRVRIDNRFDTTPAASVSATGSHHNHQWSVSECIPSSLPPRPSASGPPNHCVRIPTSPKVPPHRYLRCSAFAAHDLHDVHVVVAIASLSLPVESFKMFTARLEAKEVPRLRMSNACSKPARAV